MSKVTLVFDTQTYQGVVHHTVHHTGDRAAGESLPGRFSLHISRSGSLASGADANGTHP